MNDQAGRLRQLVNERKRAGEEPHPPSNELSELESASRSRHRGARVLAVTGGKGGVGKTVIAANLALSYAMSGKRVMMLDADFGMANLDVVLGLAADKNIRDVIEGQSTIEDIIVEGPKGLRLIPAGSGIQSLANLTQSQVTALLSDVLNYDEHVDLFIIDTAAGIAGGVAGILYSADEVIIVAEPEPTAVLDAYAVIKTLVSKRPDARTYVTVNCVKSEEQGLIVFKNLESVASRFLEKNLVYLGAIPLDERLKDAVKMRRPSVIEFPNSVFSIAIRKVMAAIDRQSSSEEKLSGGISGFFNRVLNDGMNDRA
ncbi:MAG: AAA family ATPase [Candidatus Coatesbacteria bacterium]|nr:AAA family ATPase [Candidatus Coatesbacteria bacterium]